MEKVVLCLRIAKQARITRVRYLFFDPRFSKALQIFDEAKIEYRYQYCVMLVIISDIYELLRPIKHREFLYDQCGLLGKRYMEKMIGDEEVCIFDAFPDYRV